jgi:hypothetical protein
VYNTNYIAAVDLPRAAILYAKGRELRDRTDRTAGRLEAPILIVGNTSDKTAVTIRAATGYDVAVIYNLREQIAIDSLTVQGLSGLALDELVASHRNTSYMHFNDVVFDGVSVSDTDTAVVTEAGGEIEITGSSELKNCATGAKTLNQGDQIVISADTVVSNCTTGALATGGGQIKFNLTGSSMRVHTCTTALSCQADSFFILKGKDTSTRLSIESPVESLQGVISATFVDFESTISLEQSKLTMNTCGHQNALTAYPGSAVYYDDSNTYTTGNTESTSANPVRIYKDAAISFSGTSNLVRSGGTTYKVGQRVATFSADSQALTVNEWDRFIIVRGSGADRASLTLSAPTLEGQELTLFADSFNADFIDSTTAEFASGGVALGNTASSDFASVTLEVSDPAATGTLKWREKGRSSLQ